MAIHLTGVTEADIGEVCLLVGDPARVELLSTDWKDVKLVTNSREFKMVSGYWKGKKVSCCSTGIGVSSTEIAVIELLENGARYLVRVGGCGAWKKDILPGEVIVNYAMARDSGTLTAYGRDTFPAVANPILVHNILKTLSSHHIKTHFGIGLTTQSYYLGQDRKPKIEHILDTNGDMTYWKKRSILNCEMETAAIYILASIYGAFAANCLVVHGNRISEQWLGNEDYHYTHLNVSKLVLDACFHTIEQL
ncbi:nucleoside phosphorylase [Metabacillus schmidteae]|uniref:nucleoside phosphorylase n=1 Tax=Metabacillus schmidteae TaxID=2730405 RepID=UPI00158CB580|nr:nucleoside phosphorylase [Metabacillus schmidteae]